MKPIALFAVALSLFLSGCVEKKTICSDESVKATVVSIYKSKFLQSKGVPDAVARNLQLQLGSVKLIERKQVERGFHTTCEAKARAAFSGNKGSSYIRYKVAEDLPSGGKSVELLTTNIEFMPKFD